MKRVLWSVLALVAGLYVAGCEVDNAESETTGGDTITGEVSDETAGEVVADPCPGVDQNTVDQTSTCDENCVSTGTFDPDCNSDGCLSTNAQKIITHYKGLGKSFGTKDTCDYNYGQDATHPAVCEVMFRCSDLPCFCDPDCFDTENAVCTADDHCDTWCPTDIDPDCVGKTKEEGNGKYCE
jgi:hypothetical protein